MLIQKTSNIISAEIIKQIILWSLILIIPYDLAYAHKTDLENMVLNSVNGDLVVSFKLQNVFSSQMEEVILNGTPITFTYFVELFEVRDFWLDKNIINIKIDHMLKYNVLKKEFVIKRSWGIDKVSITASFAEAQNLMIEISSLRIIPFNWLENDSRYQMAIKAELSKGNLPLSLRSALFCTPSWSFETDWYILDFNH
jgi:hypothetical protein